MKKVSINTPNAPTAIGTYSQAVKVGDTVYLSGQIPLVSRTMDLENGDMRAQITRVFENLAAVARAAGGTLHDAVKLNIYLTDLTHFPLVNEAMAQHFKEPYPARATIGVAALPKGAAIEMDAVLVLNKKEVHRKDGRSSASLRSRHSRVLRSTKSTKSKIRRKRRK